MQSRASAAAGAASVHTRETRERTRERCACICAHVRLTPCRVADTHISCTSRASLAASHAQVPALIRVRALIPTHTDVLIALACAHMRIPFPTCQLAQSQRVCESRCACAKIHIQRLRIHRNRSPCSKMSSMGSRGAWTSPRACVPLAIPTLMRKAFARTIRDVNVDGGGHRDTGAIGESAIRWSCFSFDLITKPRQHWVYARPRAMARVRAPFPVQWHSSLPSTLPINASHATSPSSTRVTKHQRPRSP